MELSSVREAQRDPASVRRTAWDAIVVGAGPAGSVTAGELAGSGMRTLLVDHAAFPRRKTCGDGLNLDALSVLDQIGLEPAVRARGREVERARIVSAGGEPVTVDGPFVTIERRWLDSLLALWAVERGAVFARARVNGVDLSRAPHRYGLALTGSPAATLHAPIVVLATGADTRLARQAGLVPRVRPSAAAATMHLRSEAALDELLAVYADYSLPGYAWIFPLPEGRYNLGVITFYRRGRRPGPPLGRRLARFLEQSPEARELAADGEAVGPRRTAPLLCGLPEPATAARGGLLAVGESVGTTLPLTGEGIGKALASARMAAAAVEEASREGWLARSGSGYVIRLERLASRYPLYDLWERSLGWPWLNRWLGSRARRSARARHALQEVIVHERGLREALSVRSAGGGAG